LRMQGRVGVRRCNALAVFLCTAYRSVGLGAARASRGVGGGCALFLWVRNANTFIRKATTSGRGGESSSHSSLPFFKYRSQPLHQVVGSRAYRSQPLHQVVSSRAYRSQPLHQVVSSRVLVVNHRLVYGSLVYGPPEPSKPSTYRVLQVRGHVFPPRHHHGTHLHPCGLV
jgi:hypothetical protein